MLRLTLNSNDKCVGLDLIEELSIDFIRVPVLNIEVNEQEFSIPLDTLRGKLNELEMMINVSR